ncbi:MAG: response regulator [Bacteroidota bacterium]
MSRSIVVLDDHPMMRRGLVSILEGYSGADVVAQLGRAEELFDYLKEQDPPDLVLVDVSLPGMSGIELVKHLSGPWPELKMLVVSRHDESLYAERALRAGAKGYVMKFESSETLLEAVDRVLQGGIYVSSEMNEKILSGMIQGKKETTDSPMELLSDRELEVFEWIGRGHSSAEIADQLHLSSKTVETYRSRIKEKLGLRHASELMFHAIKWVDSGEPNDRS